MKKKISLILIGVSFISITLLTLAYAAPWQSVEKQGILVTFIDGEKGKDGYIEVTTRSKDVYRIYPCGKVEKLTWKEIAPNTERTSPYFIDNSTLYYNNGSGSK
jgi:hypothetical protein